MVIFFTIKFYSIHNSDFAEMQEVKATRYVYILKTIFRYVTVKSSSNNGKDSLSRAPILSNLISKKHKFPSAFA